MLKQVDSSLKKLENWFEKNGTKGYDPFDVKGYNSYTLQLWENFKLLNWHQIISRLFLLDFASKSSILALNSPSISEPTWLQMVPLHSYTRA